MIRRSVKVQLLAFLLITLLTVSVLSARYVGLYDRVAGGQYHVSADFEQSGGIFVGSEVSYRGVTVGRVADLRLSKDGVIVDAKIQRGVVIPKDTKVVVENRSAVGEQYLDFQPRTDKGPVAQGRRHDPAQGHAPTRCGSTRSCSTSTRPSTRSTRRTCASVVDELGKGFADGGQDLQRLIDSGDALTKSATEALPETIKLIDDGRIVLDTQRDTVRRRSRSSPRTSPTCPRPSRPPTATCG